eukprot:Hpha_TRINITY_DN15460_c2_g7::TRINITY_DN15460_c2_g7_i1::g.176471::m.176471
MFSSDFCDPSGMVPTVVSGGRASNGEGRGKVNEELRRGRGGGLFGDSCGPRPRLPSHPSLLASSPSCRPPKAGSALSGRLFNFQTEDKTTTTTNNNNEAMGLGK